MSRPLAVLVALALAPAAHAGWTEDHYGDMSKALLDMDLTAPSQISFNALYDKLKEGGSLRCDQPAPAGTPKWDVTCTGTLSADGADLCGALAATAAMELRLTDLLRGQDRSYGVVLDCGGVQGQGWVASHKAGADGHVQAEVRKNGIVVWTRTSAATNGWTPAAGDARVLTPQEALAAANRVLAARGPVDDAWTALSASLADDLSKFEDARRKLAATAKAAAATARATTATGEERPLQDALIARLDRYVAVANKLVVFYQLAVDPSSAAAAQAALDDAAADCASADQDFAKVVRDFAAAHGLADTTQGAP